MIALAHKLRTLDYFTLAFGTMVGVGWLVVMDDWLLRGGPLGGMLGFAIGGVVLAPIGYVYGRLVIAIPDAGSEIAYTERVFPRAVSFATGWMMVLAYLIVCPWEAVAVGKIAAYIFPSLNSAELYRVAGRPVYLPHLVIGLALTAAITVLNYRGIRASAVFQNWMTFGLLALFTAFASLGLARGSPGNLRPFFGHSGFVSTLLVLQIVPYFMTGFESVAKCSEEAGPEFRVTGFFRAIGLALLAGALFYVSVIGVVAYVYPWQQLTAERFATAVAFERAFRSRWIVNTLMVAALLSLLKIFNGNFVAASRLLLALGRRGLADARLGKVHYTYRAPSVGVVSVGIATAAAVFLGESILIPVTEVGSMASAIGWLATCAAYCRIGPSAGERAIATAGALVASAFAVMKILPAVPGHFTGYEYLTLALWGLAGLLLRKHARAQ